LAVPGGGPMKRLTSRRRLTILDLASETHAASFAEAVQAGLTAAPKSIPCRYFYDEEGSKLFEEICTLPEYYLTRAEAEILRQRAGELVTHLPLGATLLELGSGSAAKTRIIIEAFLDRQGTLRYMPIDLSPGMLEKSSRRMVEEYPGLEVRAVVGEYHHGLRRIREDSDTAKLILWLGSNIGNLHRLEAAAFLRQVRVGMRPEDRMLVGVDLRKDRAVLERAYDDSRGVTARFNLNLLARINRELGGRFEPEHFRHSAVYAEEIGRIEMYLVSTRQQKVRVEALSLEVHFANEERVHSENSYKYCLAEIDALVSAAGFRLAARWLDRAGRFSVNLLAPGGG